MVDLGTEFLNDKGTRIQIRTYNLLRTRRMRELDPNDIDTLVAIKGMVVRVSG